MKNPPLTSYSVSKSENFFSKFRNKARTPILATFFLSLVLEILATAIRQEINIQIRREQVEVTIVDSMILYVENPKSPHPKIFVMNSARLHAIRVTYKYLLLFYTLIMKYQKVNIKNTILLKLYQKE